jgi:hypothetical protein
MPNRLFANFIFGIRVFIITLGRRFMFGKPVVA